MSGDQERTNRGMFGKITKELQALRVAVTGIASVLTRASDLLQEAQSLPGEYLGLADRVTELEGRTEAVLQRASSLVTEAESRFNASRAAEERTRGMMKRAERLQAELVDGDEEGADEELLAQWAEFSQSYGAGGAAEGVQPLRNGVETRATGKAAAEAAKWGGR